MTVADSRTQTDDPLARDESAPVTIPEKDDWMGPAARGSKTRLRNIIGATQLAGLALSAIPARPRLNAFGLGLIAPGAGHLANGRPGLAAAAGAAVPASLTAFFGNGNNALPPALWLGGAVHAGLAADEATAARSRRAATLAKAAVPAAVATLHGIEYLRDRRQGRKQHAQGTKLNQYLASVAPPLRGDDVPDVEVGPELTETELAMVRRIVDIGLQAPDDWSNYELIDQFRESAVRYTMTGYMRALQTLQYHRMPAFRGYVSEAQRRLIAKHQQPLVWRYWMWENLWGNLRIDADPVKKQNIMLTGWLGATIGGYERITGDLRFDEPGALEFVLNSRKSYSYSYTSMMEALARQFEESPFGLVACEPNWIYAICNTYGAVGAYLHSKVHGSDIGERIVPAFTRGVRDELLTPSGMMRQYMSTRTGFSGPLVPDPGIAMYVRAFAPDIADRGWALGRMAFVPREGGGFRTRVPDKMTFDPGNYSRAHASSFAILAEGMREAGDEERASGALKDLEDKYEVYVDDRGWLNIEGASGFSHGETAIAMFGGKGTWLNLMTKGMPQRWADGPLLDEVCYPEVLVARAVSPDGKSLELVLRPGTARGEQRLRLSQLTPGAVYRVEGAVDSELRADAHGRATVTADVQGRTPVTVRPQE